MDKVFKHGLASTHQDTSKISDGIKKEQELDYKVFKYTRAKMIVRISLPSLGGIDHQSNPI